MYLEIDEGYFEHPKTLRLCGALKDHHAAIYPIRLWKWACRSAKDGRLGVVDAFVIEKVVGYEPMDGRCFEALCSGFLDVGTGGEIRIHDWMVYTGAAVKRMEDAAQRKRDYRAAKPWDVLRLEVLQRDKYTCAICGRKPIKQSEIDVHHKIPLRKFENKVAGNNPSNLVSLCETCHATAEKEFRDGERTARDGTRTPRGTVDTVQSSPVQTSQERESSRDPSTAVPVAPRNEPGKPSARNVVTRYLAIRSEIVVGQVNGAKGVFPTPQEGDVEKAATWIGDMAPEEFQDIEPAIRLACQHVQRGDQGWSKPEMAKVGYLFGCIVRSWPDLREELHGCAPKPKPQPDRFGKPETENRRTPTADY